MNYTLRGDRDVEYNLVYTHLPKGDGLVLDLGPLPSAPMSRFALQQGYRVVGVGLEAMEWNAARLEYIQADFLKIELKKRFDWVLNISTIEHFGLAGRYGVTEDRPSADLEAMAKLHSLMAPDAKMLLTIPVGKDMVIKPWHRVYGVERLPKLLEGYHIAEQSFFAKSGQADRYCRVERDVALAVTPTEHPFYYALGLFVLT